MILLLFARIIRRTRAGGLVAAPALSSRNMSSVNELRVEIKNSFDLNKWRGETRRTGQNERAKKSEHMARDIPNFWENFNVNVKLLFETSRR